MSKVPRGSYGPNYDGVGDPERFTPEEIHTRPTADLVAAREAYRSPSVVVVRLRKAYDRALGRA